MFENIFVTASVFTIMVFGLSVFLKRRYGLRYESRVLWSTTIAFVLFCLGIFALGIDYVEVKSLSLPLKVFSSVVFLFSANAVLQFLFWISRSIIGMRRTLRIPLFVYNILSFFIIFGILLYILRAVFDLELEGLLVTSTVFSAIIGLALQDTLSNFFSGVALQMESPYNLDDWVNLGGFEGRVVEQNWRTVTLLTRENHRVSLTNKFVSDDKIVNYSKPSRRQIHNFYIELDYNHPPNQVKHILRDLLDEIDEVEIDQSNGAFVVDYMASGIKYCLRYWLHDYADILYIQDLVLTRLWYALKRHDIKIPYPISEVQMTVKQDQPGDANEEKLALPGFLANLSWLEGMEDANIQKLGEEGHHKLFAKNDLIVRQGDDGSSMFIILDGSVNVLVTADDDGKQILVAEKGRGEFFGEMSLLTGEPRTASIRAREDSDILVIDKDSFGTLIASDYKILGELTQTLRNCKSGLADAIKKERDNADISEEKAFDIIVGKIKSYFKLV